MYPDEGGHHQWYPPPLFKNPAAQFYLKAGIEVKSVLLTTVRPCRPYLDLALRPWPSREVFTYIIILLGEENPTKVGCAVGSRREKVCLVLFVHPYKRIIVKKMLLLVAMLSIPVVPALAQDSEFDVAPAPTFQYDNSYCDHHIPGEIIVRYDTPEVYTLYFEDLAAIEDPCEQRAATEEQVREVLTWPGVTYAGVSTYNIDTGSQVPV